MSRLTLVVAATKSNGIGQNGRLPWRLTKEMAYFTKVTSNAPDGRANAVIMGRNTLESIPKKFRPLKKRVNIVISRNKDYELIPSGAPNPPIYLHLDLHSALARSESDQTIHRSFVIGGAALYSEVLALSSASHLTPPALLDRILLTRIISPEFEECDAFMPDFLAEQTSKDRSGWLRASHAELQAWVEFEVPEGMQEENGVQYEFQMWVRQPRGPT